MRLLCALIFVLLLAAFVHAAGMANAPVHGDIMTLFMKVCDDTGFELPLTTQPITRLEIARSLIKIGDRQRTIALLRNDSGFRARFKQLESRLAPELAYLQKGDGNHFDFTPSFYRMYMESRYLTQAGPKMDPWPRNDPSMWDNALGLEANLSMANYLGIALEPTFNYRSRAGQRPPFENDDDWIAAGDLRRAYLLASFHNVALEVGRDEHWWGPGRFGNLLLTDNAGALDHARIGSLESFILPGPLVWLGQWRLHQIVAMLEEDRDYPHALLIGLRASTLLLGTLELSASRIVQAGGEGREAPNAQEVLDIVLGRNEHEYAPSDTNQLAQFDARLSLGKLRGLWDRWLPLREVEIWTEYGADSVHNYQPSNIALLWGALADFGSIDLTWEYVDTMAQSPWYEHYIYTDGYTFRNEIVGHEVGCCTRRHTGQIRFWTPWPLRLEARADVADKKFRQTETEMLGLSGAIDYDLDRFSFRVECGTWSTEQTEHIAGMPGDEGAVSWAMLSLAWRP